MKQTLFIIVLIITFAFAACNNSDSKNKHEVPDVNNVKSDTTQHVSSNEDADIKTVAVVYKNVDVKTAAGIKEIVNQYLNIKNALANDNAVDAANGAEEMVIALAELDKSLFTTDQKKVFDENQEELNENVEHISKNGNNIKHQRSHFVIVSELVYNLVKNFGAGRPLYHDHCPMARENQGAMWLSEVKEIKNPYFGSEMFKCGRVEEVIQ